MNVLLIIKSATVVELKYLKYLSLPFFAIEDLNLLSKLYLINFSDKSEIFLYKTISFLLKKFDIFFLDPPFADKEFTQILNLIKRSKIYNIKHILIIHRERKTEDNLESSITTILSKQYGRSKIIFGVFN